MCTVGLGQADLWSNPEFRQFREGFDVVLTDVSQDLHSLIRVFIFSQSLNQLVITPCLPSTPGHRYQIEWENSSQSSVTIGCSSLTRSRSFAHLQSFLSGRLLPHTANVPRHFKDVSITTFLEAVHQEALRVSN